MKWRTVFIFYALACCISWWVMMPLALNHHQVIHFYNEPNEKLGDLLHALAAPGPYLAAIIMIAAVYKRPGLNFFFASYSINKLTAAGWCLSLSPLFYLVIALPIDYLISHQWFSFEKYFLSHQLFHPANLFFWVMPSIFYGFFEEGGWRGFLLPYLQKKYPALKATTILTLFWIGWHIPSFFYRYQLSAGMLIGFVTGIFAGAIVLTFLFNYTKGSLLAVTIWHFTWDLVSIIGKNGNLSAIMSTFIILLATIILIRYKWRQLSPKAPVKLGLNVYSKNQLI